MNQYKQAIRIGDNVTNIMRLPCVGGVHKSEGTLVYELYDWDEHGNTLTALTGDWLCEDSAGHWHVLSDKEYSKARDKQPDDKDCFDCTYLHLGYKHLYWCEKYHKMRHKGVCNDFKEKLYGRN